MQVLVLTPEPIDAELLHSVLGDGVRDAEAGTAGEAGGRIVAPAINRSKLAYWVSDADEAILEATTAATDTVERLEEAGVPAVGDAGDSDPRAAVRDTLALSAAQATGLPVDVAEISRP